MPDFIEIKGTFCGWMDVPTYIRTFESSFIWSTLSKSRPKNWINTITKNKLSAYLIGYCQIVMKQFKRWH